jgi:hypothetical protein
LCAGKGKHAPRKTLRVGKMSHEDAETFAGHVDRLNNALIGDYPVERRTLVWLSERDPKIREKLAASLFHPQ